MSLARWSALTIALGMTMASITGCEAAPATDAGMDTGMPDVPAEPDVPADAPTCDAGDAPADLPSLTGTFVVLGGDAGVAVPAVAGGDPAGVWRIEDATIYVPETSGSMLDAEASAITGTAWIVVDADTIRMRLDLEITLVTTVAGTIRRDQSTRIRGTYTVEGNTLEVEVACIEPPPSMTGGGFAPTFGVEGERGTLVLTLEGMLGASTLVLEGTRTAS